MRKYGLFLLMLLLMQCKDKPTEPIEVVDSPLTKVDTVEIETPRGIEDVIPDLGGEGTENTVVITPISQLTDDTSFSLSFMEIDTLYIMNPSLMLEITNTFNDTDWVTDGISLEFNLFEKYISGEKIDRLTVFEPKKQ